MLMFLISYHDGNLLTICGEIALILSLMFSDENIVIVLMIDLDSEWKTRNFHKHMTI